jgi:hypothetical protein
MESNSPASDPQCHLSPPQTHTNLRTVASTSSLGLLTKHYQRHRLVPTTAQPKPDHISPPTPPRSWCTYAHSGRLLRHSSCASYQNASASRPTNPVMVFCLSEYARLLATRWIAVPGSPSPAPLDPPTREPCHLSASPLTNELSVSGEETSASALPTVQSGHALNTLLLEEIDRVYGFQHHYLL